MRRNFATIGCIGILLAFWLTPSPAYAYIGPGAGLSAIGAFFAIVAAIVAALFGFIWFPVKRLIRKLRKPKPDGKDNPSA